MAETDFTSDITAENGNNLEEATQEEPNPERKYSTIKMNRVLVILLQPLIQQDRPIKPGG